jgi:hypothetical protein
MHTLPIKYPSDKMPLGFTWRGLLSLALTVLAVYALWYALRYPAYPPREITQQEFFELIKDGRVVSISNQPDAATGIRYLTGVYHKPLSEPPPTSDGLARFKLAVDLALNPYLLSEIQQAGYRGTIETINGTNVMWPLFLNLALLLLMLIVVALTVLVTVRWVSRPAR